MRHPYYIGIKNNIAYICVMKHNHQKVMLNEKKSKEDQGRYL